MLQALGLEPEAARATLRIGMGRFTSPAEAELAAAFGADDLVAARRAALRLRYLQKLIDEARARHARLLGEG